MPNYKPVLYLHDGETYPRPLLNASGIPVVYDADAYPSGPPPECCCPGITQCDDCDPAADEDPMAIPPLDVVVSGAIDATDQLPRVAANPGEHWAYENTIVPLDADGCGDPAWLQVSIRIFCDTATKTIKCLMTGGGGGCSILTTTVTAVSGDCEPFSVTFEFRTQELFPGGCPCGDDELITVVATEA